MTDVFISYKRRLRPRVEAIAAGLRRPGLTVWYDAALEAGTSFSAEISNEVRTAGCVLVCWSDDAFAHGGDRSGWVVGEATIGQERGCLVPVLLEEVSLDPPWNTFHAESLVDWTAASSIVLAAIAAIVAAMPSFNFEIGNSAIIWLAAVWQLVYAPALVFVLRAPRR